jgi:hypothetical protein
MDSKYTTKQAAPTADVHEQRERTANGHECARMKGEPTNFSRRWTRIYADEDDQIKSSVKAGIETMDPKEHTLKQLKIRRLRSFGFNAGRALGLKSR